jgi:hypothetical protein
MRITSETLLKLANDEVARRADSDRGLIAAYLHGSLLGDSPLLGNTGDIDLFLVHSEEPNVEREIVRITDEIHFDITHHGRKMYRQPRALRLHAWLGPILNGCKILYDPQHFLDFTQASVRGQFDRPDNVLRRTRPQYEHARQIWMSFYLEPHTPELEDAAGYIKALDHVANAIAGLSGPPLTERRFLLELLERAEAVKHAGLYAGFLGLLGAPAVDAQVLRSWLPDWRAAYTGLSPDQAPARLHPHRLPYYERAIEVMLGSERYQAALWPLWRTWTHAVIALGPGCAQQPAWQAAGERLGLLGPSFTERVAALDAYLDTVEEMLDDWGRERGA